MTVLKNPEERRAAADEVISRVVEHNGSLSRRAESRKSRGAVK